jgi:hypothetical protein
MLWTVDGLIAWHKFPKNRLRKRGGQKADKNAESSQSDAESKGFTRNKRRSAKPPPELARNAARFYAEKPDPKERKLHRLVPNLCLKMSLLAF